MDVLGLEAVFMYKSANGIAHSSWILDVVFLDSWQMHHLFLDWRRIFGAAKHVDSKATIA